MLNFNFNKLKNNFKKKIEIYLELLKIFFNPRLSVDYSPGP